MSDTVLVALIGVVGTLLGMFGSLFVDRSRAKSQRQLHIATVRFDHEFRIYQELSEKHLTMVYDIGTAVLISRGSALPAGIKTNGDFIMSVAKHIDEADMQNKRSAPFISKEIYESYKELGELAFSAISMFDLLNRINESNLTMVQYNHKYYDRASAYTELVKQQKEVSLLSDKILDQVRCHLIKENNE